MENPIKMDDLEVPLYLETPIYLNINTEIYTLEVQVDYFLYVFSVKTIVLVGIYFINNSRGLFFLWSLTSRVYIYIFKYKHEHIYT